MTDPDTSICTDCGTAVPESSRYCPSCGQEHLRLKAGDVLDGKYEILGKVAEGGMGEVYRARHIHLDEIRIIKLMKPGSPEDGTQERRFSDEARMATMVRHPNVAALFDFARLASGSFYMVWEYIDGMTLLQLLRRRGRIAPDDAIDISLQVLSGLSEIHRVGIVHRDISPDNIMIVDRNGLPTAKIIDLGIAKRVADARLGMTSTGMFLGKLKYCSPEQAGALKPGEKLDARTDIYSFGAVLYEMLSGKPLFESPTPEGYIVKHLQEAPPPLDLAALPASSGPLLSAAIQRSLQKDRTRRFASAADFADALASIRAQTRTMATVHARVSGLGPENATRILARGSTSSSSVSIPGKSKRVIARVAMAGVALGILALAYAWWQGNESRRVVTASAPAPTAPLAPAAVPTPPISTSESSASAAMPPATSVSAVEVPGPAPAVTSEETPKIAETPRPSRKPRSLDSASTSTPPPSPAPDETQAQVRFEVLRDASASGNAQAIDDFVNFVNDYVGNHPDTPVGRRIRTELPTSLKTKAEVEADEKHPLRAAKLLETYKRLTFAPADPEVDVRLAALRPGDVSTPDSGGASEYLVHAPLHRARADEDVLILARWPGSGESISGVLHYRSPRRPKWREVSLTASADGELQARIPSADVHPPGFAYYIEATTSSGQSRHSGTAEDPYRVRVDRR